MAEAPALRAFLENFHDEAYDVLEGLRDFVAVELVHDRGIAASDVHPLALEEVKKAIRRMADVMAWLLLQKAIAAGEIERAVAGEHLANRIASEPFDPGMTELEELEALPIELRSLIDRSRRVYENAVRLKNRDFTQAQPQRPKDTG